MKIVLIGAGNVSSHIGPLFRKSDHQILQVFSRSAKSAKALSYVLKCEYTTNKESIITSADVYIVAIRDETISTFLKSLSFIPKLIVHTSGSTGIDVFPKKMNQYGVMYPLQTFSKYSRRTPDKIPFCIEGSDKKAFLKIKSIARSISPFVYNINSDHRKYLHLAAVFANNFSNYLFVNAANILKKKNIPFDLLRPLIEETALKVQKDKPEKMQTGPARRGDAIIIRKHLQLLNDYPEMKKIYKLLSENIENDFGMLL
jgi:predicted short-subunit dehydrogenase-like oxidoreductase (DUF2520 family)